MTTAVCPKCNGSTRQPLGPWEWKNCMPAGYDKQTDTVACDNCGGQTMSLTATGRTRIDPATGLGCEHTYTGRQAGNCYRIYTCTKCGDHYDIDSGD